MVVEWESSRAPWFSEWRLCRASHLLCVLTQASGWVAPFLGFSLSGVSVALRAVLYAQYASDLLLISPFFVFSTPSLAPYFSDAHTWPYPEQVRPLPPLAFVGVPPLLKMTCHGLNVISSVSLSSASAQNCFFPCVI